MAHRSTLSLASLALAFLVAAAGCATAPGHRDALWHIVNDNCVPAALAGRPSLCAQTDLPRGDIVLKDRNGILQYLLIPTMRITGIEDPQVLQPAATVYFADAWQARGWMERLHGGPIPPEDVAIAVNSQSARSQDQLHLHVSCIRADLKAALKAREGAVGDQWTPWPGGWRGHPYEVRRFTADTLAGEDPFSDVAAHVAGASGAMGSQGIAVVGATFADGRQGFWLLETHAEPSAGWQAGIEDDVQDHGCAVLG